MNRTAERRLALNFLVRAGKDLSLLDDDGNNFLHMTCLEGDLVMMLYVLAKDIFDINSRGKYGRTSVMIAGMKGRRDMLGVLVKQGGNVSLLDDDKNNILHLVCSENDVKMAKYVLSWNIIDIDSRGKCGMTPAMTAAVSGCRELLILLLQKGADTSLKDDRGNTAFHWACTVGDVEVVQHFLSMGNVDIDGPGQDAWTPVMMAAGKGHRGVFSLLVRKGCDLTLDAGGTNILHAACIGGDEEIVEYVLLQDIVDVNKREKTGRSPVMMAAEKGHRKVFEVLWSKGIDLKPKADDNSTILHIACVGGDVGIVSSILSLGTVDINGKGMYGRTPAMIAAEFGHWRVFDLLAKNQSDITITDHFGNSCLHVACLRGRVEMVNYLLFHQLCEIKAINYQSLTPAMMAAAGQHMSVFHILTSYGIDRIMIIKS